MLWVKAFHIIAMVTWFSGIFYLPRLFVYHALSKDDISIARFKVMERKLFFGIMTPGAVVTTIFGVWLMSYNFSYYNHASWMQIKLCLVLILWMFHLYCGYLLKQFAQDKNKHSHVFYRWINEFPVLLLMAIVILVIVKP